VSPDEATVVVTGSSDGVDTEADYATIAYDADTGEEQWVARHNGPGNLSDNAGGVAISPTGDRVFVTGFERGQGAQFPSDNRVTNYATLAYDLETGEQEWFERYDGPGNDSDNSRGIVVSPDGGTVVVTGYSHGGDQFWDYATRAYDTETGDLLWEARYDGLASALDVPYSIAMAGDRVIVTGESLGVPAAPPVPAGDPNIATVAYDLETGEQLWEEIFNHAGRDDKGFGVAVAEDEFGYTAFVTGRSFDFTTRDDYVTLAYRDTTARPVVAMEPSSIESVQEPDEVVNHILTIGNEGNADLTWDVFEDTSQIRRRPKGAATRVITADVARPSDTDDAALSEDQSATANADAKAQRETKPLQAGTDTITHSQSQQVMAGNSVACSAADGSTVANAYLRAFTLEDFGIESGFEVTDVSFGIENLTIARRLTVNLYTLDDEPFTYANMTRIGTAAVELEPQSLSVVTVPVTGFAPAGSTLVAEVTAPDMTLAGRFFIGSNNAGQTAPSYLSSTPCNLPEPTDTAEIDAPNMHIVMNVSGTPVACETPSGTPWADVTPLSGTVAPASSQDVDVTIDASGLAPGIHSANLCITSNDPAKPMSVVPVDLTVTEPPEPPNEPPTDVTVGGFTRPFTLDNRFAVTSSATDPHGIDFFELSSRRAPYDEGFKPTQTHRSNGRLRVTVGSGTTACFAATATDTRGATSDPSAERCSAVPLNNQALEHKGFEKKRGAGHYLGSFSKAKNRGASLQLRGVRARRLALVATRCRACGSVKVLLGNDRLKTISLKANRTKKRQLINLATFNRVRTGRITIVVTSGGKLVRIEGLGVSRT
jgi:PQQ-like domain